MRLRDSSGLSTSAPLSWLLVPLTLDGWPLREFAPPKPPLPCRRLPRGSALAAIALAALPQRLPGRASCPPRPMPQDHRPSSVSLRQPPNLSSPSFHALLPGPPAQPRSSVLRSCFCRNRRFPRKLPATRTCRLDLVSPTPARPRDAPSSRPQP